VFLALVGVYGLLAASVDQRARELSIRAALGATPRDILASVAFIGLRLTAIGLGLGLLASMAASSLLSTLLYDVQPRNPLVFALVPVGLCNEPANPPSAPCLCGWVSSVESDGVWCLRLKRCENRSSQT